MVQFIAFFSLVISIYTITTTQAAFADDTSSRALSLEFDLELANDLMRHEFLYALMNSQQFTNLLDNEILFASLFKIKSLEFIELWQLDQAYYFQVTSSRFKAMDKVLRKLIDLDPEGFMSLIHQYPQKNPNRWSEVLEFYRPYSELALNRRYVKPTCSDSLAVLSPQI